MQIKLFTLLVLVFLSATQAHAATRIPPDDTHIGYTGRIDFFNQLAPEITWPSTSVALNFTGRFLSVTLDDQRGANYFNAFVDDDFSHPFVIHCAQGEHTYLVAKHLNAGSHHFLLTKRTEGEEGWTKFKGITLADHAQALPSSPKPTRKIEFYGDSITSGMANEAALDSGVDNLPSQKNNFLSYAAITARALNAEPHIISQSGIGIMISWFDFTMPEFYMQLSAAGKNDSRWDFKQWTPDVVVINLTQNDHWLIDEQKRIQPVPTDEQRIAAYVEFVNAIRANYPDATIICALGSMDATRPGSKWPGYISSAVTRISTKNPSAKIYTLVFPYTGYNPHPRIGQHHLMAEQLTQFIRDTMHW